MKETADKVTKGAGTDLQKARSIYDFIVDNTSRDPKIRGCGRGDISSMLKSQNLTGKCADLNALYVGLARAAGLPARDVYGIRVGPSELGYKSLGASSPNITKAQLAGLKCTSVVTVGYPRIPRTCEKLSSKSRPEIGRLKMRWQERCGLGCLDPGR